MSSDEKSALIGRVISERNALQQELRFVDVALERCAADFKTLADVLLRHVQDPLGEQLPPISDHLRQHVGLDKLENLLLDQQSLRSRLRACKQQAFNLGAE